MSSCPEQVRMDLMGCHSRLDRESMNPWRVAVLLAAALISSAVWAQSAASFPGVGRAATDKEVKAWDIDVRPDFKGLPAGSGSVKKGQEVWESKCASCHGVFGESTQVFNPLVGGTTAQDVKSGRVARLLDPAYPSRSTMMKVANLSTLWDYINRAMPWTAPKSLTSEEVYAVTGYMLNLAGVVPDDYTLSDKNMRETQALLPNRKGLSTAHALWPGKGLPGQRAKPDVQGSVCMKDCLAEPKLASYLPDYARDAHGNLAEQQRMIGAQHGADTSRPETRAAGSSASPGAAAPALAVPAAMVVAVLAPAAPAAVSVKAPDVKTAAATDGRAAQVLLQKNSCTACHAQASKVLGPSWSDIASKHAGKADYLVTKIKSGGSGQWGPVPMPPQSLNEVEAKAIATWLASGAAR